MTLHSHPRSRDFERGSLRIAAHPSAQLGSQCDRARSVGHSPGHSSLRAVPRRGCASQIRFTVFPQRRYSPKAAQSARGESNRPRKRMANVRLSSRLGVSLFRPFAERSAALRCDASRFVRARRAMAGCSRARRHAYFVLPAQMFAVRSQPHIRPNKPMTLQLSLSSPGTDYCCSPRRAK